MSHILLLGSVSAEPAFVLDGDTKFPMPGLGFGTCCRKSAKGPPLIKSTLHFLQQGGRLIDTAQMYGNHQDLAQAVAQSGLPRAEIWITSKVNTKAVRTRAATASSVRKSAKELGVAYIDLMLIHGLWTMTADQAVEVWRGLIDAKGAGTVRHIGVSNFEVPHIQKLVEATGIKPAVHQLEFHPWVQTSVEEVVAWCHKQGIAVTAYGSLGGASNQARGDEVAKVAQAHSMTSAQVLLRWALSRGVAVIPGATSEGHIRENLNLPPLELSAAELASIGSKAAMPTTFRRWGNLPSERKPKARRKVARNRSRKKRRRLLQSGEAVRSFAPSP